jgi:hypothetical protein
MQSNVKTSFQQLEDAMEIAPAPVARVIKSASNNAIVKAEEENNTPEALAREARDIYRRALGKAEDLLDEITEVAKGSEHARDFEVANGIVQSIVEIAEKIQKSAFIAGDKKEVQGGTVNNVQQNVFYGDTSELLKLIKNAGKDVIDGEVVEK